MSESVSTVTRGWRKPRVLDTKGEEFLPKQQIIYAGCSKKLDRIAALVEKYMFRYYKLNNNEQDLSMKQIYQFEKSLGQ